MKLLTHNNTIYILETYIKKALERTADKLQSELMNTIYMDYYELYSPVEYERTYQFLNSVTRTNIYKNGTEYTISIYVDYDSLGYDFISGYGVVKLASEGFHGSEKIRTPKKFFEEFKKDYSPEKIKNMLLQELKVFGLNIV